MKFKQKLKEKIMLEAEDAYFDDPNTANEFCEGFTKGFEAAKKLALVKFEASMDLYPDLRVDTILYYSIQNLGEEEVNHAKTY